MHTALKLLFFFFIATVLHWLFIAMFGSWGMSLNFMLVFAVAVCAFVKPEYGYPSAFLCGLFLDFFGVKLFGHHALIFTLCAMIVYVLKNRLDFDSVISQMVCIAVLGTAAALSNLMLLKIFAGFSAWSGFLPFVGGIVASTLISPIVFYVIHRAFSFKQVY